VIVQLLEQDGLQSADAMVRAGLVSKRHADIALPAIEAKISSTRFLSRTSPTLSGNMSTVHAKQSMM
jgi:hypothetical protein